MKYLFVDAERLGIGDIVANSFFINNNTMNEYQKIFVHLNYRNDENEDGIKMNKWKVIKELFPNSSIYLVDKNINAGDLHFTDISSKPDPSYCDEIVYHNNDQAIKFDEVDLYWYNTKVRVC